jgi:hypothetical protein
MEPKAGRTKSEKKDGKKWVDANYKAKTAARDANGIIGLLIPV